MHAFLVNDLGEQRLCAGGDVDHRADGQRRGRLSERDLFEPVEVDRAADVPAERQVVAEVDGVERDGRVDDAAAGDERGQVAGQPVGVVRLECRRSRAGSVERTAAGPRTAAIRPRGSAWLSRHRSRRCGLSGDPGAAPGRRCRRRAIGGRRRPRGRRRRAGRARPRPAAASPTDWRRRTGRSRPRSADAPSAGPGRRTMCPGRAAPVAGRGPTALGRPPTAASGPARRAAAPLPRRRPATRPAGAGR